MAMVFGQWVPAICMLQAFGYIYGLPIILFLFNRLRIFRAIAHFLPARLHLYICSLIFHSRSMPLRYKELSSTGAREYACRGLYLHAALVLEQPNHDSLHSRPHHACDLMIRTQED